MTGPFLNSVRLQGSPPRNGASPSLWRPRVCVSLSLRGVQVSLVVSVLTLQRPGFTSSFTHSCLPQHSTARSAGEGHKKPIVRDGVSCDPQPEVDGQRMATVWKSSSEISGPEVWLPAKCPARPLQRTWTLTLCLTPTSGVTLDKEFNLSISSSLKWAWMEFSYNDIDVHVSSSMFSGKSEMTRNQSLVWIKPQKSTQGKWFAQVYTAFSRVLSHLNSRLQLLYLEGLRLPAVPFAPDCR